MKKLILSLLIFIPFISFSQNEDILLNGTTSAENNQIKNVADPTDTQDAVTKNFVYSKAEIDSLIAQAVLNTQNQINNLSTFVLDLEFSSAVTFESAYVYSLGATGMIGSPADNSLFISTRDYLVDSENNTSTPLERVLKISIDSNSITEKIFEHNDYVTKRLHIEGDELMVFGGQYVNTYNLDLSGGDPTSMIHGKVLTRFGMTELDGNAYLIGGGLNDFPEKIYTYNIESEMTSDFTSLPQALYQSNGAIVDDFLYVFGGSGGFGDPVPVSTTAYKINMNDPSNVETFQINQTIDVAFVDRVENLIYVAGQIITADANSANVAINPIIGVYNTYENTFQELSTNLTNTSGFDTIHQMCILNGKMYIIYGSIGSGGATDGVQQWEVLVSDLD